MKHRIYMYLRSATLLGIACAAMPETARACNVPVFRYAMERWPADPYQIVVYYRPGQKGAAFGLLRDTANYSLQGVDVTRPEGKALAERQGVAAYPWVEIYYPAQSQVRTPVWAGPLTSETAKNILNSPSRSRLAEMLLGGDVAVWVLVKSGHDEKDRRALDSLKSSLDRASAALRIPETGVDANGNAVDVTDFKTYPVRFGLMEVARHDLREELLVNALLASEPDLSGYDEPMAFPVFGRGRALYALAGNGIQEKNIREACESLLAWCSCEIKAMSPGTDLLIAADWSRPFGGRLVKDPELPLTSVSAFLPERKPVETAAVQPGALCKITPPARSTAPPAQAPAPRRNPLARNLVYLAAAAGVALAALSVVLRVKAKR
ncbi:MAG: hypothetical protein ACE15B_07020 [Bryobacteraceae bacterium]